MKNARNRSKLPLLLLAMLAVICTSPVLAEEKSPEDWQYSFELYMWTPRLNVTPDSGGDDITFKFTDIFKNLDMAFMADTGARKGDMSMGLDLIYLNLGKTATTPGGVIGLPGELTTDFDLRSVIGTFNAGYTVSRTQRNRLDIIGGARYLYLNTALDFDKEVIPGVRKARLGAHNWDFLVGLEGKTLINDQWYFDYYGDVGSGESKLTWQARAGFGYEFNRWTATFGARYLRWKFPGYRKLSGMDIYGPYFGAKWSW